MAGGVPPHWKHPGVLNGRIVASNAAAQGDDITSYYAIYDPYDYYSTYLDHVWCLGEDTGPLPDYRFHESAHPYVYQTLIDVTGIDLIRFCWYLRSSEDMPTARTLVSAGTVIAETTRSIYKPDAGAVIRPDDNIPSIQVPYTVGSLFENLDRERHVEISGMPTAANNGVFRISAVPAADQVKNPSYDNTDCRIQTSPGAGEIYPGQLAVIENAGMVSETGNAATVSILGGRWVGYAYIDGVERVRLEETRLGRAYQRNYLAFNVSQKAGTVEFKFELALEVS